MASSRFLSASHLRISSFRRGFSSVKKDFEEKPVPNPRIREIFDRVGKDPNVIMRIIKKDKGPEVNIGTIRVDGCTKEEIGIMPFRVILENGRLMVGTQLYAADKGTGNRRLLKEISFVVDDENKEVLRIVGESNLE